MPFTPPSPDTLEEEQPGFVPPSIDSLEQEPAPFQPLNAPAQSQPASNYWSDIQQPIPRSGEERAARDFQQSEAVKPLMADALPQVPFNYRAGNIERTPERDAAYAKFMQDRAAKVLPTSTVGEDVVASAGSVGARLGRDVAGYGADVIHAVGHPIETAGNLLTDPLATIPNVVAANTTEDTQPLPIEESLAKQSGFAAGLKKGAVGLGKLAGQLMGTALLGEVGVPPIVSTPVVFGTTTYAETRDPKAATTSAVLGLLFPVIDSAATKFAGDLTASLARSGKVTSRTAQKALETSIRAGAMQATMQAMALPEYIAHPEQSSEIFANNLIQGLAFHVGDAVKTFMPSQLSLGEGVMDKHYQQFVNGLTSEMNDYLTGKKKFRPQDQSANEQSAQELNQRGTTTEPVETAQAVIPPKPKIVPRQTLAEIVAPELKPAVTAESIPALRSKLFENMQGRSMFVDDVSTADAHLKLVLGKNAPSWEDLSRAGIIEVQPAPDGTFEVKVRQEQNAPKSETPPPVVSNKEVAAPVETKVDKTQRLYDLEHADLIDAQKRVEEATKYQELDLEKQAKSERDDMIQRLAEFDKLHKRSGEITWEDSDQTATAKALRDNPNAGLDAATLEGVRLKRQDIEDKIYDKEPIPEQAVNELGLKLPDGYELRDGQFLFEPEPIKTFQPPGGTIQSKSLADQAKSKQAANDIAAQFKAELAKRAEEKAKGEQPAAPIGEGKGGSVTIKVQNPSGGGIVTVTGTRVSIPSFPEGDFVVYGSQGNWRVVEKTTGLGVGKGKTKAGAIANANEQITTVGTEKTRLAISRADKLNPQPTQPAKSGEAANLGAGLPTGQGMSREEAATVSQGEDLAGFKVNVVSKAEAVALTGVKEAAGYGGFYYRGQIYLVHENMGKGNIEAAKALLREEVGHGLLRTEAGTKLVNEALAKAKLQLTPEERKILRDKGYREDQLLDEFIAKSAMENRTWWNDLVARTKRFFEGKGFKATNEEVARALLRRIRREIGSDVSKLDGAIAAGEPTQPKDETVSKPFYSRLTRTVEESQQGKATGAQWKATIRNSKTGINRDEYALVGVEDLEDGKAYTKQEVLDYLKANEVVVKDVTLGGLEAWRVANSRLFLERDNAKNDLIDLAEKKFGSRRQALKLVEAVQRGFDEQNYTRDELGELHPDLYDSINRYHDALSKLQRSNQTQVAEEGAGATHYSNYQLPGAKEGSYREILLTVPEDAGLAKMSDAQMRDFYEQAFGVRPTEAMSTEALRKDIEKNLRYHGTDFVERQGGVKSPMTVWRDGHSQYQSVANPIVRLRFNERATAGKESRAGFGISESADPNSGRKELQNLLSGDDAALAALDDVNPFMLRVIQNDKVRSAVVSNLPVDVVNMLAANKLSPADAFSKDAMMKAALPAHTRHQIAIGIVDALTKTHATARAKILDALLAGLDKEILPAVRASDLSTFEVRMILSVKGMELGESSPSERFIAPTRTAGERTEVGNRVGSGSGEVGLPAPLARLLNSHAEIVARDKAEVQAPKRIFFIEEIQPPQKGEFEKMPALFQKNWREIAFKFALRKASEEGFDALGWTTGEQQSARYDLSKQVDKIVWGRGGYNADPMLDGFSIQAFKNGNRAIERSGVKGSDLESLVGKDMAAKIITESATRYGGSLEGVDLKVGGQGLIKLYDVDFRNVVNNLPAVKKAGQKVGMADVGSGFDNRENIQGESPQGWSEVGGNDTPPEMVIHSLEINPQIRESVMGGQPLAGEPTPPLNKAKEEENPFRRQVMGVKFGEEYNPKNIKAAQSVLREKYFDGTKPVTPENTAAAWNFSNNLAHLETGKAFGEYISRDTKSAMGAGLGVAELTRYAQRQFVETGDSALWANVIAQYHKYETNQGGGFSEAGSALRAAREATLGLRNYKALYSERDSLVQKLLGLSDENFKEFKDKLDNFGLDSEVLQQFLDGYQSNRHKNFSKGIEELKQAILDQPYRAQTDLDWIKEITTKWLEANGLTHETATALAGDFTKQFNGAINDAKAELAKNLLSKAPPKNLEGLLDVIRAGGTDPMNTWSDEYAKKAGWKPPTPEQHRKLADLDMKLSNPDLTMAERKVYTEQMMAVYRHIGVKPRLLSILASNLVVTNLTGEKTATVNIFAPIGNLFTERVLSTFAYLRHPSDVKHLWKSFVKNLWEDFAPEFEQGMTKDAFSFVSNDMEGAKNEMKRLWEDAFKDWDSKKPLLQSRAVAKWLYGSQQYVMRFLGSVDQANMMTTRDTQMTLYGMTAFRDAGFTSKDINILSEMSSKLKAQAFDEALNRGADPTTAMAAANYQTAELLQNFMDGKIGETKSANVAKSALLDAYNTVGRRAEGVDWNDEGGLLSRYLLLNRMMKWATELRSGNKLDPALGVTIFGYVNVPLRTTRFLAWNSPYGLMRMGIHYYRKWAGKENWWKQSLATEYQERHRLKMAIAGTVVFALAGAAFKSLFRSSATDTDQNGKPQDGLYITGAGPKAKQVRDAWEKNGFNPGSLIWMHNGKPIAIPMTRAGEALAPMLAITAALDDREWRKKEKELTGKKFDESVPESTLRSVGTYAYLIGQRGVLQNVGAVSKLVSGEGGSPVKVLAGLGSSVGAGLTQPWLGFQRTLSGLVGGAVDRSSVESIVAANFPVLGLLGSDNYNFQQNRMGDKLYDHSWYGKLLNVEGLPIAFRVADTKENRSIYPLLATKGVAPPDLSRTRLETKFGELTDAQFAQFARISGAALKQTVASNIGRIAQMTPDDAKKFLTEATHEADLQAQLNMRLIPAKGQEQSNRGTSMATPSFASSRATTPRSPFGRTSRPTKTPALRRPKRGIKLRRLSQLRRGRRTTGLISLRRAKQPRRLRLFA